MNENCYLQIRKKTYKIIVHEGCKYVVIYVMFQNPVSNISMTQTVLKTYDRSRQLLVKKIDWHMFIY